MNATPRTVRAARTMTRIRQADEAAQDARWHQDARRRTARQRGYHGPLTRDEATVITLADLNACGYR